MSIYVWVCHGPNSELVCPYNCCVTSLPDKGFVMVRGMDYFAIIGSRPAEPANSRLLVICRMLVIVSQSHADIRLGQIYILEPSCASSTKKDHTRCPYQQLCGWHNLDFLQMAKASSIAMLPHSPRQDPCPACKAPALVCPEGQAHAFAHGALLAAGSYLTTPSTRSSVFQQQTMLNLACWDETGSS